MTPFERSARFWLRAYPRRWRDARGDEVLAVIADLAPGAARVGARAAAGLVAHGWAERLRGRPPVWGWIGYRFFRVALDAEYRRWMQDDIRGALYPARAAANPLGMLAVGWFFIGPAAWALFMVGFTAVATVLDAPAMRRRGMDRALAPCGYPTRREDEVTITWEPMPRVRAAQAFRYLAVVAPLCAVVGVAGRVGLGESLVAGPPLLGVGLLVAGFAAWRLRGFRPVGQPDRELVGMSRRQRVGVPISFAVLSGGVWLEVSGAWVPYFTGLMAVAGLLLAPCLVLAAVWSSRRGGDVAAIDVSRVVLTGHVRVDEPRAVRSMGVLAGTRAGAPERALALVRRMRGGGA